MAVLPASAGARNHLVRCGDAILKIAGEPHRSVTREIFGLQALPRGVGPRLIAHASPHVLRERAARARAWDALLDLDLPVGHCLLLERVDGAWPAKRSEDDVMQVGRMLARLHRDDVRDGPRMLTGSHPGAIHRGAEDAFAELASLGCVDAGTMRALRSAMGVLRQQLDSAPDVARVRTLCHGDLRWHNVLRAGERFLVVDLEHAGIGDPAVDLALMAVRTPLTRHEELCLLDAYLGSRRDKGFLERYFLVKPLLGVLGAMEAVLDLSDVARGHRAATVDVKTQLSRRGPPASEELRHALERVLPFERVKRPVLRFARPPRRKPRVGTIAIDGTAMSGKSLIASSLAEQFGMAHLNTGLLYRYVALHALREELGLDDVDTVLRSLGRVKLALLPDGSLQAGRRVLRDALTVLPVDGTVANWARLPEVRAFVGARVLVGKSAIVEGRDVGTVLCPEARKVFVDAELGERARRLVERTQGMVTTEKAKKMLAARDRMDATRRDAPMMAAPGAIRMDATSHDVEGLVAWLARKLR